MAESDPNDTVAALVFRWHWTEADAVGFRRCTDRLRVRPLFRWLGRACAIVLGGISVWYIADEGLEVTAVLFLIASAYILVVLPFERVWSVRRHYRRHPEEYTETEVRLTADRVASTGDEYRLEIAWCLLGGIADVPAGLLFYSPSREPTIWLPARLFEGNDLREQVLDLAADNGVRVSRG